MSTQSFTQHGAKQILSQSLHSCLRLVLSSTEISKYLRDCVNHVHAEFYAAVCVVRPGVRDPADAVVAVAQQLDAQAVVLVRQLVKPETDSSMK